MAGGKRWTKDELNILKENYGIVDTEELSKFLKRSVDSLQWKASQLGLKYNDANSLNINERFNRIDKQLEIIKSMLTEILDKKNN